MGRLIKYILLSIIVMVALTGVLYLLLVPVKTTKTYAPIPPATEVIFYTTPQLDPIYEVVYTSKYTIPQQDIILLAYEAGKPYDLGYTLAAIAIQESIAGAILVNYKDPSFGIYHNVPTSVIARIGLRKTQANINYIASKLITDPEFATKQAIAELLYWKNRYKHSPKQWSKMVMSYNAGTNYKTGNNYLKAILKHIKALH